VYWAIFCYFLSVNVGSYQSTICLVRTKGKLEAGRCVQSKILEPDWTTYIFFIATIGTIHGIGVN
jgi:hypothetical protein